jgi:hypothetical protein
MIAIFLKRGALTNPAVVFLGGRTGITVLVDMVYFPFMLPRLRTRQTIAAIMRSSSV